MHRDPRVMATLGGVRSESRSREYLAVNLAHWDSFGQDEVELAYALMPKFWGRGIATEIALALFEVAFARLGRPSVIIYTLPDNQASRRVAEKSGFGFEGFAEIDGLRHVVYRRLAPTPR